MQILNRFSWKQTVLFSIVVLIVLGLSLSILTWQNLRQQRQAIDRHVALAARSIARGVQANLFRGMRTMRMHQMRGNSQELPTLRPAADMLLQDLVQNGDLVFLQLRNPDGSVALTSPMSQTVDIPAGARQAIRQGRTWNAQIDWRSKRTLLFLAPTRPHLAPLCSEGQSAQCSPQTPPFLVLGLDMEDHLALYSRYRRNAVLQSGYVLVVALALWGLALAYLRRRQQGRRVDVLETFQTALLDTMPEALLTLDAKGRIQSVNRGATQLFASPAAAIVGKPWREALPLFGAAEAPDTELPRKWTKVHFGTKEVEAVSVPLEAPDADAATLLLLRDRTELAELEKDLEETRKLATIGRLAAGLAHEIRNPLSALRGFAQYFAGKFAPEEQAHTYAQTMVREADRLNRVVTDLLYMARPQPPHPQSLSLRALAEDLERLLGFDLKQHSTTFALDLETDHVWADEEGLRRILLNLLLNSLSALPEAGGHITLATQSSGTGIWILVRDTGQGMDEATREQALEPFFTTKDRGTGLGLALVHRIVRDHGGSLEIRTAPDAGTEVALFFPGPDRAPTEAQ
ncbi:two-component system sensor histidine kinase NtrB [Desulfohalobium retbaense]|uniref:histidine kinase n=1 Tax=Desulfohalobium retbaense (strain ATCC 49708 / DSM 5692 / JCM 16813 / HR100) TaxID=485915 RepID=C8X5H6_DESRD|nr:ATP-binding protein [Desulfohalobium retbaense]ACV69673.1 PAS/PAC sensor signal transduction histidine kinase [Desulfohalobium retbaense DSM 5692]